MGLCVGWGHGGIGGALGGQEAFLELVMWVVGVWCLAQIEWASYCVLQKSQVVEEAANSSPPPQIICIWGWRMCELLGSMRSVQMEPHSCLNRFLLRSRLDNGSLPENLL